MIAIGDRHIHIRVPFRKQLQSPAEPQKSCLSEQLIITHRREEIYFTVSFTFTVALGLTP